MQLLNQSFNLFPLVGVKFLRRQPILLHLFSPCL
jgi:hypothetical protein